MNATRATSLSAPAYQAASSQTPSADSHHFTNTRSSSSEGDDTTFGHSSAYTWTYRLHPHQLEYSTISTVYRVKLYCYSAVFPQARRYSCRTSVLILIRLRRCPLSCHVISLLKVELIELSRMQQHYTFYELIIILLIGFCARVC